FSDLAGALVFLINATVPHAPSHSNLADHSEDNYEHRHSSASGSDRVHNSSPLFLVIRTSQVCHSWRRILLGSPSIWGRLLHLDDMNNMSSARKYELLGRTGDAPLCIRGSSMSPNTEFFFFGILQTEWRRIKEIDVRISHTWSDSVWNPLLGSNHALQYFRLLDGQNPILKHLQGKVFSDSVPSLRSFLSPTVAIDLHAPWLAHLRDLELSHVSVLFTPFQALRLVRKMTFLTSLALEFGESVSYELKEGLDSLLDTQFYFEVRYPPNLFAYVDYLFLLTLGSHPQTTTSVSALFLSCPEVMYIRTGRFLRFARKLSSLTTLSILPMRGLDMIADTAFAFVNGGAGAPIFPALKVLKISARDDVFHTSSIHNFLLSRKKIGVPLSILDLTSCRRGTLRKVNLRFLETFEDLKVVWREASSSSSSFEIYICKSGCPDQLDFTRYANDYQWM
ncbi:hypothetical protein CVT26_008110, partial [Gymnopilus dilepis]